MARRARDREVVLRLLWESSGGEGNSRTGALPTFTIITKGLCMVPHLMEDGEIWPGWEARWGDVGHQN